MFIEMSSKVPSFKGLQPASAASSRIKSKNRRSDTKHEILLRHKLWQMGFRYRKNLATLPGKPDIVFHRARVLIFCDGDFWHGRDWEILQKKLRNRANADYWVSKIASNIERDQRNNAVLRSMGWRVLRFWETDIIWDPSVAASCIRDAVLEKR